MHRVGRVLSVSQVVGIGTPPPLQPPASVLPHPLVQGGGHTRLRLKGWGSPNSNEGTYTVVLYIYKYFVPTCGCGFRFQPEGQIGSESAFLMKLYLIHTAGGHYYFLVVFLYLTVILNCSKEILDFQITGVFSNVRTIIQAFATTPPGPPSPIRESLKRALDNGNFLEMCERNKFYFTSNNRKLQRKFIFIKIKSNLWSKKDTALMQKSSFLG